MKFAIESVGPWRVAVSEPELSARFVPEKWMKLSMSATGDPASSDIPVSVEVVQNGGGMMPRALISGLFHPQGSELLIEVGSSGGMTQGRQPLCRSSFDHPLVVGLPLEFAEAALEGFARIADLLVLPPGVMRINAAGYDEVDSNKIIFQRAAETILWSVQEICSPQGLQARALIEFMRTW